MRCTTTLKNSFGFIGLGRMGFSMAQNLRNKMPKSDKLIVFDIDSRTCESLQGDNIEVAKSVAEVARNSTRVMTMLPEPSHVKAVYKDIVDSEPIAKLFIDSSTIDVQTSLEVGKSLGRNTTFVDAPVSGGVVGAKNASLTFMVGSAANSSSFQDIAKYLSFMGSRVIPCGKPGAGLAAKLANNYLLAINNIATCEAFRLADKFGLDMKLFSDIVNSSTGRSWSSVSNNPVPGVVPEAPSSRNYDGGFGVTLMRKDLKLAIKAAQLLDQKLLIADRAAEIYDEVSDSTDLKAKDMSVIYQYIA